MPRRKAPEENPEASPASGDAASPIMGLGGEAKVEGAVQPQTNPKEELRKIANVAHDVKNMLYRATSTASGIAEFVERIRFLLGDTVTEEDVRYIKSKFISTLNTVLETLETIKKIKEEVSM